MKLEAMRRTMMAMAEMDIEAAQRLMGIAEILAEKHPRELRGEEVKADPLTPYHDLNVQMTATAFAHQVQRQNPGDGRVACQLSLS